MHLWTLYRDKQAGEGNAKSEYYQLTLEVVNVDGRIGYAVTENHGWWKDGEWATLPSPTFSPETPYPDFDSALERIQLQVWHRAKEGFVHLFEPPSGPDLLDRYRELDINNPIKL
jgi:hypothetical protein